MKTLKLFLLAIAFIASSYVSPCLEINTAVQGQCATTDKHCYSDQTGPDRYEGAVKSCALCQQTHSCNSTSCKTINGCYTSNSGPQ